MTIPTLTVSTENSPHAPLTHSGGPEHRNQSRDFDTVMHSLIEKGCGTKTSDASKALDKPLARPTVHSVFSPSSSRYAQNNSVVAVSLASSWQERAPTTAVLSNSQEANPKSEELSLAGDTGSLAVSAQNCGSVIATSTRNGAGQIGTIAAASPAAADVGAVKLRSQDFLHGVADLRLRVLKSVVHFDVPLASASRRNLLQANLPNDTPPTRDSSFIGAKTTSEVAWGSSERAAASTSAHPADRPPMPVKGNYESKDGSSTTAVQDSSSPLITSQGLSDTAAIGTTATVGNVELGQLPKALADAIDTLQISAEEPSTKAPDVTNAPSTLPLVGKVARELEIQLSPDGLGSLFVRMKLSGGALSVVIEASKPSTVSSVESERESILKRITAEQQLPLSSLIIRPFESTTTQSEENDVHQSTDAHENEGNSSQPSLSDDRGAREKPSAPEDPIRRNSVTYVTL